MVVSMLRWVCGRFGGGERFGGDGDGVGDMGRGMLLVGRGLMVDRDGA